VSSPTILNPMACPLCGAERYRDDEFYREFGCGTEVLWYFDGSGGYDIEQDEPCKRRQEAQRESIGS
jgi:hypothetical protein